MSLNAFVSITRPLNSLAVGVLVLASCLVAGAEVRLPVFLAVLGSVLIAAGGYVLNDVFDYETDKLIHPDRVLPQGRMSRAAARTYGLLLLLGAPFLFLFINPPSFLDAALAASLLFLYSWKLKRTSGVTGNLLVALLASNGLLIGGFVTGNLNDILALAACVLFATLAREIAKDVEDLPGDRLTRRQTLPMMIGRRAASRLAAFFLLLAALTTYLPYQQAIFGQAYLLAATAVNVLVLGTAARLAWGRVEHMATNQRLIKVGMFSYIAIFLLAALFDSTHVV
ncbi:MAG: UbiA family prenyltransferase [Chloroflexi bacterium]|nr:UbiA family prenyltransferase [Chloroflexota bacterium]